MLLRHTAIYMVSKTLPAMAGIITTMLLTRLLTPAKYGVVGLGALVMMMTTYVAFDWQSLSFLRFHRDDEAYLSTYMALFILVAAPIAAGACAVFLLWIDPEVKGLVAIGMLGGIASAWFDFAGRRHMAALAPAKYLRMNLVRAVSVCLLSLAAAYATRSPLVVLAANAAGIALSACAVRGKGAAHFWRGIDWTLCKEAALFGLPIGCSVCLAWIIDGTSRVMLSFAGCADAVGFYTAAFVFASNSISILASGVGTAVYPLVFSADAQSPADVDRRLAQNFELLLALLVPAAAGMTLLSGNLARLLVGPQFVGAVAQLIPWMAVTGLLASLRAQYFDMSFQLSNRTQLVLFVVGFGAALNILLNWFLIPVYGYLAPAWAGTIVYGIMLVHSLLLGRRMHPMPVSVVAAGKILAGTAAMALCLWPLLRFQGAVALALQIPAGVIVYGAAATGLDVLGARRLLAAVIRGAHVGRIGVGDKGGPGAARTGVEGAGPTGLE